ncbi:hypothetical protein LA6_002255 [Marinibacterium anthonyi]|nr:hypothetical protein LA6_002255 [Marinibacterium anthonyi]
MAGHKTPRCGECDNGPTCRLSGARMCGETHRQGRIGREAFDLGDGGGNDGATIFRRIPIMTRPSFLFPVPLVAVT